jgi:hypothetical protein
MAKYHCGGIEYETPADGRGVSFRIKLSFDVNALSVQHRKDLYFFNERGDKQVVVPEEYIRLMKAGKLRSD